MRIYVKNEDKKHGFWILIPSVLLFNHLAMLIVWFGLRCAPQTREKTPPLRALMAFVRAYWRSRLRHPLLYLVDVRSSDGSAVKVRL